MINGNGFRKSKENDTLPSFAIIDGKVTLICEFLNTESVSRKASEVAQRKASQVVVGKDLFISLAFLSRDLPVHP